MASGPITSWQRDGGKMETLTDYFLGLQNHCGWWTATMKLKDAFSLKKSYDNPRQLIKKQKHHFASTGSYSQGYGFPSSHVLM